MQHSEPFIFFVCTFFIFFLCLVYARKAEIVKNCLIYVLPPYPAKFKIEDNE